MHRLVIAVAAFTVCLIALGDARPAVAANAGMKALQHLVGTWSCTTKTSQGNETGTIEYRAVRGSDALEYLIHSEHYNSAGYIGYDSKTARYVNSNADAFGGTLMQAGTLDKRGTLTLTGNAAYPGSALAPTRETLSFKNAALQDRSEMKQGSTWVLQNDTRCARAAR